MTTTGIPSDLVNFDALPDSALVNIKVLAAICGRSVSSTWRDLRAGRIPNPVRSGINSTRWRVGDIRKHLEPALLRFRPPS